MLILGLTGNIGCGKSSLSKILMQNNIDVIDADIISRNIFEDKELLNAWFCGFFPSEASKYVVVILVEQANSGSTDSAPIFKKISEQINNLY